MHVLESDRSIRLEIDPSSVSAFAARDGWTASEASYHPWKDTTGAEYGFCRGYGDEFFVQIHDVARFSLNRHADEVRCAPAEGVPLDSVQDVFYCEVVPFLLQQRSWEVLHACGLDLNGIWIGLSGNSQVGKSTLAHAWRRRGGQVFADDAIPFRLEEGRVSVCPIPFHVRLRQPSIQHFGVTGKRERVWATAASARTLSAVFMLERRPETEGQVEVELLDPARALPGLLHQAYSYMPHDRRRNRSLVETYMDLANVLPTFRFSYPTNLNALDAVLDRLIASVQALGAR